MPKIIFTLNGKRTSCSYEPGMQFLEVLREELGIVSPKNGCAPEGTCGCCAILVDGRPALSCLRKPEQMEGHDVVTLEGVPEDMREVLGEAFVHEGGVQCGFCIPGMMMRAQALLERNASPSQAEIRSHMNQNLCRCGTHMRILRAIERAAAAFKTGGGR